MRMNLPPDSGITTGRALPELDAGSWFEPPIVVHATLAPRNLIQIGAFTGVYGGRLGHCRIGRYCSIAADVDIASDQHPTSWLSSSMVQYVADIHGWGGWLERQGEKVAQLTNFFDSNSQVHIGNDVWIGQGVFIKSGLTIGNGAIIAAHSVVIRDVPAYSIVAGVPATVKKMRFSESVIDKLEKSAWWQYNVRALKLDFRDPVLAVDAIQAEVDSGQLHPYAPRLYKPT